MERDHVSQLKANRPIVKFTGPLSDEPWEMKSLRIELKDAINNKDMAEQNFEKSKKEIQSWI